MTTTTTTTRNRRKTRVGKVVSDRMDKTVVVTIERLVKHPTVGRYTSADPESCRHRARIRASGNHTVILTGNSITWVRLLVGRGS